MSEYYDLFRALHIISVIFWMAALLYLPRLFIYHHGAEKGGELEQTLILQERRLLKIIMTPAMMASLLFGIALLTARSGIMGLAWMHPKFLLIFILFGVHGLLSADRRKFERGERPRSEKFYRILNEVPAILTIGIVLLAVLEPWS